jgi:hypothetical protein
MTDINDTYSSDFSDDASPTNATPTDPGASGFEPAIDIAAVIETLQKQLADQNDKYLRLAAEYDNYRKRSVRERQEAELRGMGILIRGILDALDDLGRFAHVDPATTNATAVQQVTEVASRSRSRDRESGGPAVRSGRARGDHHGARRKRGRRSSYRARVPGRVRIQWTVITAGPGHCEAVERLVLRLNRTR